MDGEIRIASIPYRAMLPLPFVREHADEVRENLRKRNVVAPLDEILELDRRARELRVESEALRAERNRASRAGKPDEATRTRLRAVGERVAAIEKELKVIDEELTEKLLYLPNMSDPSAPVGPDESHDVVGRSWGEPRTFSFTPRPHWEVGERLGILDIPRGVKLSGSRFYVLKGAGAALQRALITWMIDLKVRDHGFIELYPPFMARPEMLVGTGSLPKSRDVVYKLENEELFLIPTAEPQLLGYYRDEILDATQLPLRVVGYTACFRNEKMSAGRDVRGIKRGFQFDKVEMFVFCKPEESAAELDLLVRLAAEVLEKLELPYRLKELCTGDMAFQAAKAIDLEVWSPGVEEWLEVSTCSNCTEFQSHRGNVRMRRSRDKHAEPLHTLNGSGLALPRLLIAVLENYQREDGSVEVPRALRPYLHGLEAIVA
ncbi:MAG TPA: serine--tRNA ligase [Candidatus Dormibacteraeota bacterium]|nr:serine--tRNA ligase [Candidatus Dormibacteraeota bacterium]